MTIISTIHRNVILFIYDLRYLRDTYLRRFSKLGQVESVDFEEPDGENIRLTQSNKSWRETALADIFTFGFGILVAVIVALAYLSIYFAVNFSDDIRTKAIVDSLLVNNNTTHAWLWYFIPMVSIALFGALVSMYEPGATGSGMPEVISNLNGIVLYKQMNIRVFICRHIGLICIISSGLYSGYDGPIAYTGLMVAVLVFTFVEKVPILSKLLFADKEILSSDIQEDLKNVLHITHKRFGLLFSASGAAAGIAAAFHAPVGGAMFALEEAISFFNPAVIIRTLFTSTIAYLVVGWISHYNLGDFYLFADEYALFPNDAECTQYLAKLELLGFALMGLFAGLIGHIYNRLIITILRMKIKFFFFRPWLRLFEVVVVCIITSILVIYIPQNILGGCKPFRQALEHIQYIKDDCLISCGYNVTALISSKPECFTDVCISTAMKPEYEAILLDSYKQVQDTCAFQNRSDFVQGLNFDQLVSSYIPPKNLIYDSENMCYYPLYSLLFSTPDAMLRLLFSRGAYNLFDITTLSVFSVVYLILSVITHNIMMPTDLVLPNIILGASLGRLYGVISNILRSRIGSRLIDPGSYSLLGAAALWSGTSRIAMTISIIMMETSFDFYNLPAVIVVVTVASIVGNWFGPSLYHMEIEEKKLPYLPETAPPILISYIVKDLLRDTPLIYFHRKVSTKTVYENLAICNHQGFPVVEEVIDANGETRLRPIGIILRSQLRYKFLKKVQVIESNQHTISTISKNSIFEELFRRNRKRSKSEGSTPTSLRKPIELQQLAGSGSSNNVDQPENYGNLILGFSPVSTLRKPQPLQTHHEEVIIEGDELYDISLLMSHPVHSVNYNMSARKAYRMFRNLGLRHLCVVDDNNWLVGIVSRKDFVKAFHGNLEEVETIT